MNVDECLFGLEQHDQTLIMTPKRNLSELEFSSESDVMGDILARLDELGFRHLIVDFAGTDYCGSTAISLFLKLWKRVCCVGGSLVFCNASAREREILQLSHLDSLWTICSTREEAFEHLRSE
jgi:anti-anti-sigma factor